MKRRRKKKDGPSLVEQRLRSELDQVRRDLKRAKHEAGEIANGSRSTGARSGPTRTPHGDAPSASDLDALHQQVEELTETRQRLSRLYFSQVEENRKRAKKLHEILENISKINANLDLDGMLQTLADTIRRSLGFGMVLIRLREPGTSRLRARAFAGIAAAVQARLEREDIALEDFQSWLRDEFKVSRSYFISHTNAFNQELPKGYKADLGPREEWEWHSDDVLLVPLFDRGGELQAYFSLDDPVDRLVPSRESIEMLEIFGHHAVVAIENARLYRELEEHSHDLEVANQRMQELHTLKSNFVSTVSHELRTPLTVIRAYIDTLLAAREGAIQSDRLQQFLSIINEESQRLARLIESVLDLNRLDSGMQRVSRQPMNMAEVLEETRQLLQPVAQAGKVDLKVAQELADTRVDADRDQMRQLALHLGSNAVKFTPPGGTVRLRLFGDSRDVTLQVEDSGIGIPEEALDRVFERFYQVDSSLVRQYGGTGLGLAICKSIVDWHGGRIFVESSPGSGSRFTVVMPRRTGPRVTVRPTPRRNAASEDTLRLALEMVAEVMNARVVSLLSPERDGSLVVQAAIGLDDRIVREARIQRGSGVAGWVAVHRRPVCVTGEEKGEFEASGRDQYRSGTFLSVPLEGRNGLLGVLNVTDPAAAEAFDAEDCHLLLQLAERVGAVWEQALTTEQGRLGAEGTAHALRQVLPHLERGRRTAPDRVRMARAVARELGLPEAEVGVISFAASVQDAKRGQDGGSLSAHALPAQVPGTNGGNLPPLEGVGVVRDVILSTHEWWDGSGYPRGLKGKNIPMGGRILAVIDAHERAAMGDGHGSKRDAKDRLRELRKLRGKQFDSKVVEAFGRVLSRLEKDDRAAA